MHQRCGLIVDIKALGPNESAQTRTLTYKLTEDTAYVKAEADAWLSLAAYKRAEARLSAAQDEFKFLLTMLGRKE